MARAVDAASIASIAFVAFVAFAVSAACAAMAAASLDLSSFCLPPAVAVSLLSSPRPCVLISVLIISKPSTAASTSAATCIWTWA